MKRGEPMSKSAFVYITFSDRRPPLPPPPPLVGP